MKRGCRPFEPLTEINQDYFTSLVFEPATHGPNLLRYRSALFPELSSGFKWPVKCASGVEGSDLINACCSGQKLLNKTSLRITALIFKIFYATITEHHRDKRSDHNNRRPFVGIGPGLSAVGHKPIENTL